MESKKEVEREVKVRSWLDVVKGNKDGRKQVPKRTTDAQNHTR